MSLARMWNCFPICVFAAHSGYWIIRRACVTIIFFSDFLSSLVPRRSSPVFLSSPESESSWGCPLRLCVYGRSWQSRLDFVERIPQRSKWNSEAHSVADCAAKQRRKSTETKHTSLFCTHFFASSFRFNRAPSRSDGRRGCYARLRCAN